LDSLVSAARTLTEAAARACVPWIGGGNKEAADAAAVEALREMARTAPLPGRVVIGEGEKDDAPYLAPGTQIGPAGADPIVDVAVDPLEGTDLVANDRPGALSVLALAPIGTIRPLGRAFYAEQMVGPPAAADVLDLDASPSALLEGVADVLGRRPADLTVAVQERPRHADLIDAIRSTGARVHLFGEGSLSFAVLALQEETANTAVTRGDRPSIDLLWGTMGAPEGLLTAAAQRCLGGAMRFRPAPRSDQERARLRADPDLPGVLDRTYAPGELVRSHTVVMTLTGVTEGPLLDGIDRGAATPVTESLVLVPNRPPRRRRARGDTV
jgi:fructose-1,6-bisphosphatase II